MPTQKEIAAELENLGLAHLTIYEYVFGKRMDEVLKCVELLEDDESAEVYTELIEAYVNCRYPSKKIRSHHQYFALPEFKDSNSEKVFVDCGGLYGFDAGIFLSGQVKRSDFASLRGVRQFGAQENNIVDMVKPIKKYAVLLENPEDILYELEKCIYYATYGRQGSVWLDITLDVQAAEVDENNLRYFSLPNKISDTDMDKSAAYTVQCLNNALNNALSN